MDGGRRSSSASDRGRWSSCKPIKLENAGLSFRSQLWLAENGLDPVAGIRALVEKVRLWFPTAFEQGEILPASIPLQHAFAGLVMLADWLGSDREAFPYAKVNQGRMPFAREAAAHLFQAFGLDASQARAALGASTPGFKSVSIFAPRAAQAATLALPLSRGPSLTILESETGSGKTEAALARFLQLFHCGAVDGLTFALPTRTSAIQIHRRVVAAIEHAFPDATSRPPVVLAVPGYLQVDDVEGKRLPGFEVLWNDQDRERWRFRGWAGETAKRYLAGAIVVGSIDQVLLSALQVGNAHLGRTALLRHLLIVDEVHASDAYMNATLEEVLRFHGKAGGNALLMSATLGCETRTKLQAAMFDSPIGKPTLNEALKTAYPAVHHSQNKSLTSCVAVEAPGLPKNIEIQVLPLAADYDAIVDIALTWARQGARVLILRNTVKDAMATQEALETAATLADCSLLFRVAGVPTLHHSRFAREDRILLDEAIEGRLGQNADQTVGFVGVATQTVRQSLDLDADYLITDLAPMDVLLQRFGRVHRHRKRDPYRPPCAQAASGLVLTGEEALANCINKKGQARGTHGAGSVYPNVLILEATLRQLVERKTLHIPEENRELVELTVHSEELERLAISLKENWMLHFDHCHSTLGAEAALADINTISDRSFGDFEFGSKGEKISTRLGDDNYRVQFTTPAVGPFGKATRELNIPAHLLRGLDSKTIEDSVGITTENTPSGAQLRFTFGGQDFVYNRLGLQKQDNS